MKIIFTDLGAVDTIEFDDIWVVGDNDSKRITADFTAFFNEEETTITDYDACEIIIQRANGDTSNTLPMIPDYDTSFFHIDVDSWVTNYAGEVSITVRLKKLQQNGSYVIIAGGLATYNVQDGIFPNGEATITDAQYQALVAAIEGINLDLSAFEDFMGFDLMESELLTDATNILVEQSDTNYIAKLSTLVEYLKTKNTVQVADISDQTLSTGVYVHSAAEFDIVIHYNENGANQAQVGIIGGNFVYRKYEDGEWVNYSDVYALVDHNHSGVYEPANANIQGHISATNNPHGVTAGQVGTYTTAEIDTIVASMYKPAGSLTPAELVIGLLIEANLGKVYNITAEFTSDSNFKEGAGITYPVGANVVVVLVGEDYKFDVLMGYNIGAESVTYNGSNVADKLTDLEANKADIIVNRVYYGSSYITEPAYMVLENPTMGTVSASATASINNLIFRNYRVLTEDLTINAGQLFSFNFNLQRVDGGANTTSTVTVYVCKFAGDPTSETDRNNPALYALIGSSLPYTANFGTAVYLHKTIAAAEGFVLEMGDILCFRVYVNPSATSTHNIVNTVNPILLSIPEQGFQSTSDNQVNASSVEGASVSDALEKLKDDIIAKGDPFDEDGTYIDLKVGLAYNLEGAAPYLLNEAFDLRVTAGEDVEVKDGLAKVKELQAVVNQDGNGIITDITSKPTLLITTNDNLLEFLETYENTSYGVKVEIIENGVVRIYGTATDDIALETHRLSKYFGLANNYDASAILYATVIAGEIPAAAAIYFNDIIDSGITDGIVGTNASVTLAGATKYINQLEISLDIPDTTEIDVTIRFYTKHASNPNQTFVFPNPLEHSLYTSEIVEANDWFKDNVINYETKQFTKYWHKYIINGSEASWSFYGAGSGAGTYVHILELATELTDLLLTAVAGAPYNGVLKFIGRASTYGITNMVSGDIGILYGTDLVNGIVFATADDLETFKNVFSGSYPLPVWIKHTTPTIRQLTTIDNEILYPAYNYGLEFGLLHNKLKVEYSSDFQKQITTNLENIVELKATKAETYETSVTIGTADWVADGVTATYKAIKTVNGVLSSDNPILAFDLDGIADNTWNDYRTEFAKIGLANTTDDDEITFYASAIPTQNIAVIVKVVR